MARASDNLTADLFEVPQAPEPIGGSLDYAKELSYVLSDALKKCPYSRHQVAARMSELTGQDISKATLDAWTAESKERWRFPFEYAAAFEVATEQLVCLQELLARKRGSRILVGEETLLAELGRVHKQRAELAVRERALKKRIREKR